VSVLIKKDPNAVKSYLEDSSNLKGGHAEEVVFPSSTEELSDFLKEANSEKRPVTISGGGTGTTGSRIAFGGAVVSMERFNRILDVSDEEMSCAVGSGVLVDDLKRACEAKELFYASHPTERTAFVGGTVATNASGARSFKYGSTRRYVRRLKMVLADGEIFEIRRGQTVLTHSNPKFRLAGGREICVPIPAYKMPAVKNSAGYFAKDGMDLIDLFIGQEGTLSVITEIELGLVRGPSRILGSFVFFEREPDAWGFAEEARRLSKDMRTPAGSGLDALSIEYFDANALNILRPLNPNVPRGMNAAIFFEQEVSRDNEDMLLEKWLALIVKHRSSPENTWVAMNEKEAGLFTDLRHHIPEAINDMVRQRGFQKLSTDIAVPDGKFSDMIAFYTRTFKKIGVEHVVFGHIGECHVHTNLLPKNTEELERSRETVLSFVKKGVLLGGTVSAEHGIGKTRHKYLEFMYGKGGILQMASIKKVLDPNCILGLDNIFPRELLITV